MKNLSNDSIKEEKKNGIMNVENRIAEDLSADLIKANKAT